MKEMTNKNHSQKNLSYILGIGLLLTTILLVFGGKTFFNKQTVKNDNRINGLIYLIQNDVNDTTDGLLKWETELNNRGITALFKASKPVLEKYPEIFKKLARKGHVIMGGYPGSCWDLPYEEQYQAMKETKEYMEELTGKPMQVFACMYNSYDENTVKAADALGVPYVLARGTEGIRAVLYKPVEYNVKLLEVSNVEFGEMGRGSLCDASLIERGATEEDFLEVFNESVAKKPDSMILVSQPHISGVKAGFWNAYRQTLETPEVAWTPFDTWMKKVETIELPYQQIPENREIEYLEANLAIPLEELEDLPNVGEKILMFHNGQGPMCLEAKEFFEKINHPFEEHLNTEKHFVSLLDGYRAQYPQSEGVSTDYEYYPIIFFNDHAYSGFDDTVEEAILKQIEANRK